MKLPAHIKPDYLVAAGVLLLFMVLFAVSGHRHAEDAAPPLPGDQKGFHRDCVEDVLNGDAVRPSCQSFAAMRAAYHLDPQNMLIAAQAKSVETARRVARGEFRSPDEYRQCVVSGDCAAVPVVPSGVDPNSPAGRAAQGEFWHLAQNGGMTEADCNALDICRAFVKLRLITPPPPLAVAAPAP